MNQLAIIIPTLNEEFYISDLLQSIVDQQFHGSLQVIVVDGQSQDATVEKSSVFSKLIGDLTVLSAKADIGGQRNYGVSKAKYPYLLFLDADVVLPASFLDKLSVKIKNEQPFIGAVLHTSAHMGLFDYGLLGVIYFLFLLSHIAGTPVTNGDCILTTKSSHERIGGFKEGAILGEDTDYGIRAVRAGAKYKFFFAPHIIASDRRVHEMGRFKLLIVWSKAFLKARKDGPTYSGVVYTFGKYGKPKTRK